MALFEVGDLAWAKMKGFTPWPAQIAAKNDNVKPPKTKEPLHYVFFFGSNNYSWILESNLYPFEEFRDQFWKKNATPAFKFAVSEIFLYADQHPRTGRKASIRPVESTPKANGIAPKKSSQLNHKRAAPSPKDKTPKMMKLKSPKRERSGTSSVSPKKHRHSSGSNSMGSTKKRNKYLPDTPPKSSKASPWHRGDYGEVHRTSGLLTRPTVDRVGTPTICVDSVSEILKNKNVIPTNKSIGFIGLGIMGRGIVKNLIHSGHKVTVWNRSPDKCTDFVKHGAMLGHTPQDVVAASDITFSCISDPTAAREMVFCSCGVLKAMENGKGYVEMTSIDPDTSIDIAEAITARYGKYLEAPILGSKKPAEDGTLTILAAGDKELFGDCRSCFEAMGERVFYLGDVGKASKMNLVINMVMGSTYSALAEAMSLAERTGISQNDVLEVLEHGPLKCSTILEAGRAIVDSAFSATNMPLQHMQKNLHLALDIGDQCDQTLPSTAAANEVFKHAKRLGYGLHDVSAVYMRARF